MFRIIEKYCHSLKLMCFIKFALKCQWIKEYIINSCYKIINKKKMSKYFGFNRLIKLYNIIQQNGGLKNTYMKLYRNDDLKLGCLVGTDKYGNKYYENPYYFYGRNRWVEFADHVHLDYDASQIPAEWFGWMHYKTDIPPTRDGQRPKYKWMADHSQNLSGTKEQYMPYSTTQPKIEAWDGKRRGNK